MDKINHSQILWTCRVRELRKQAGLSLRDLEKATGLTNAAISLVERGTNPTLSTALKLAEVFGLKIEDIWTRIDPNPDSI
jgi:transcriptional regulator with XRE-family HTH domain